MAARDPFQKTFTSLEEMLSNPGSRMRSNPSKAYDTIAKAVKDSGGWIQKKDFETHVYVVLSGPYTGTYTMLPKKFVWTPEFDFGLPVTEGTIGLIKLRYDSVMKHIAPLRRAVQAAYEVAEPERAKGIEDYLRQRFSAEEMENAWARVVKRWQRPDVADFDDPEDYDDDPQHDAYLSRESARQRRLQKQPEKEKAKFIELWRISSAITYGWYRQTVPLYILAQAGGVPVQTVIEALEAAPRRIIGIPQDRSEIPTRYTDRKRFAEEFLRTWSKKAAVKRIMPNVEGDVSPFVLSPLAFGGGRVAEVRQVLTKLPSWKQLTRRDVPDYVTQEHERTAMFLRQATIRYDRLAAFGMKPAEFRELLQKRGLAWLSVLNDSVRAVQQSRELLAETEQGRQLLRALNTRDWPRVHREHNRAMAAVNELYDRQRAAWAAEQQGQRAEQLESASEFKKGARQFTMIEGVRPLTTEEEYKCEGDELGHCVYSMGYMFKKDAFEFGFTAPDGTRATLELGTEGIVRQFFGPRNCPASPATREMLKQFLAVNADKIEAMKVGEFPVKENRGKGTKRRRR